MPVNRPRVGLRGAFQYDDGRVRGITAPCQDAGFQDFHWRFKPKTLKRDANTRGDFSRLQPVARFQKHRIQRHRMALAQRSLGNHE